MCFRIYAPGSTNFIPKEFNGDGGDGAGGWMEPTSSAAGTGSGGGGDMSCYPSYKMLMDALAPVLGLGGGDGQCSLLAPLFDLTARGGGDDTTTRIASCSLHGYCYQLSCYVCCIASVRALALTVNHRIALFMLLFMFISLAQATTLKNGIPPIPFMRCTSPGSSPADTREQVLSAITFLRVR